MKELLNNVSLFWGKYFKDVDVLYALLEGSLSSVSDAYTDSMSCLLSNAIDSAPLTVNRKHKLLQLEDSKFITMTDGGWNTPPFLAYDLGESSLRRIPFIAPSPNSEDILEAGVDYEVLKGSEVSNLISHRVVADNYYIFFNEDIRKDTKYRSEAEYSLGYYIIRVADPTFDEDITTHMEITLKDGTLTEIQVVTVAAYFPETREIYLSVSTPVESPELLRHICISINMYEVTAHQFLYPNKVTMAWGLNCDEDTYLLRDKYGYMYRKIQQSSTEEYRNYLAGITLLRTASFSNKTIKATICLTMGVPVFVTSYEDGDRIIRVESSPRCHKVVTTISTYEIPPTLTIRADIKDDAFLVETIDANGILTVNHDRTGDSSHTQSYKFSSLDCLITDIDIKTEKSNPNWWDRGLADASFLEIPEHLMLGESLLRRTIINHSYANEVGSVIVTNNNINYSLPPAAVGDYGIKVGDQTRNTVAYNLFKDFLQHHFVFIELNDAFMSLDSVNATSVSELEEELNENCVPGTVIYLTNSLDSNLPDTDNDGIPNVIDPDPHNPP